MTRYNLQGCPAFYSERGEVGAVDVPQKWKDMRIYIVKFFDKKAGF